MREVKIQTWCDECFSADESRVPADRTFTVGIVDGERTNPPVKLLELCQAHSGRIDDLLALLAEVGTVPKPGAAAAAAAPKKPGRPGGVGLPNTLASNPETECPACGATIRTKSLVSHMYSQHLGGLVNKPVQPGICPTCRRVDDSPQAMGIHRAQLHGWSPAVEAVELWEEQQAAQPKRRGA